MTVMTQTFGFPTSQPDGFVRARIEADETKLLEATWSMQTIEAGPTRSSPEYDAYVDTTAGSSYDWSDELRFDKRTGQVAGFVLKVPEQANIAEDIARTWIAVPKQSAGLVLEDRKTGFHLDPFDVRYFAPDGSALLALGAEQGPADAASTSVAIASDVELLFQAGRYCGWLMRRPVAHLVVQPEDGTPGVDDARLHGLISEYMALVVYPYIDRMSDRDPDMQAALQSLKARAGVLDGGAAAGLVAVLERVLETFYLEY